MPKGSRAAQPPDRPDNGREGDTTIRIVVADDHNLVREAVSDLLSLQPDLKVVAQAADGHSAVEAAANGTDVVLLDLWMPGPGPRRTLRELRARVPQAKVILLTGHRQDELTQALLDEGASGYIHKSASREVLLNAVREAVPTPAGRPIPAPVSGRDLLTEREHEVLRYVAQALSNRQIGTKLTITEGTVKRHLRNIFAKLGATSRIDAVNKAQGSWGPSGDRKDETDGTDAEPGTATVAR
ncbi:response regulator transcription factor [Streptomyces sp. NPDC003038]|uniref:response regulator transcription factor n=1 Tax=unclassified Streptomyces TaxID=2593676 RepID=UPI0033BF4D9E